MGLGTTWISEEVSTLCVAFQEVSRWLLWTIDELAQYWRHSQEAIVKCLVSEKAHENHIARRIKTP